MFGHRSTLARALLLAAVVAIVAGSAGRASAGTNYGAKLILHYNPNLLYTFDGSQSWDGYSDLWDCKDAGTQVSVEDGSLVIFYLLAAFDNFASPEIKAMNFGISYSSPLVAPVAYGPCGGDTFEVSDDNWPASGTGTAMSWTYYPLTRQINEVYWFASYAYSGQWFKVTTGARDGAGIRDNADQPEVDYVANTTETNYYNAEYFGMIGFGRRGNNPCNPDEGTGACCSRVGACIIQTRSGCAARAGYTYTEDDQACNPNPCQPGSGACCIDGECRVMLWDECIQAGTWIAEGVGCDPSPCTFGTSDSSWGVVKTRFIDR